MSVSDMLNPGGQDQLLLTEPRRSTMLVPIFTALVSVIALTASAGAQNWPTRPMTMVVPAAAGGSLDLTGRILASRLSELLGRQVIVENVGGGGGIPGT